MVYKSQHILGRYVAHIITFMMHLWQQIQHIHFTHNLIAIGMDGEHDDVHLNIT
jgi:hypothetical protein